MDTSFNKIDQLYLDRHQIALTADEVNAKATEITQLKNNGLSHIEAIQFVAVQIIEEKDQKALQSRAATIPTADAEDPAFLQAMENSRKEAEEAANKLIIEKQKEEQARLLAEFASLQVTTTTTIDPRLTAEQDTERKEVYGNITVDEYLTIKADEKTIQDAQTAKQAEEDAFIEESKRQAEQEDSDRQAQADLDDLDFEMKLDQAIRDSEEEIARLQEQQNKLTTDYNSQLDAAMQRSKAEAPTTTETTKLTQAQEDRKREMGLEGVISNDDFLALLENLTKQERVEQLQQAQRDQLSLNQSLLVNKRNPNSNPDDAAVRLAAKREKELQRNVSQHIEAQVTLAGNTEEAASKVVKINSQTTNRAEEAKRGNNIGLIAKGDVNFYEDNNEKDLGEKELERRQQQGKK